LWPWFGKRGTVVKFKGGKIRSEWFEVRVLELGKGNPNLKKKSSKGKPMTSQALQAANNRRS